MELITSAGLDDVQVIGRRGTEHERVDVATQLSRSKRDGRNRLTPKRTSAVSRSIGQEGRGLFRSCRRSAAVVNVAHCSGARGSMARR